MNRLKGFGEHLLKVWRRHDQKGARHCRECFDGFNRTFESDPRSGDGQDSANRTQICVRDLSAKRMGKVVPNSVEPNNTRLDEGRRRCSIR